MILDMYNPPRHARSAHIVPLVAFGVLLALSPKALAHKWLQPNDGFDLSAYEFKYPHPTVYTQPLVNTQNGCKVQGPLYPETKLIWEGSCNAAGLAEGTGAVVYYKAGIEYLRLPLTGYNGLVMRDGRYALSPLLDNVTFVMGHCEQSQQTVNANNLGQTDLKYFLVVNHLIERASQYVFDTCYTALLRKYKSRDIFVNYTIKLGSVSIWYAHNPYSKGPEISVTTHGYRNGIFYNFWSGIDKRFQAHLAALQREADDKARAKFWGAVGVVFWVGVCGAIGLIVLRISPRIIKWAHYVFVPHPATKVVKRAAGGRPLDGRALSAAMATSRGESLAPAFMSENRARKAKAAAERLKAETELMNAAVDRERARGRRDDRDSM